MAARAESARSAAAESPASEVDSSSRSEMKDYLESFFRTIDKPDSIKKQFVNGCKPQPTM